MSVRDQLEDGIRQLFAEQSLAVVATQGEAGPHTSLVAYTHTQDLRTILFATSRATRKCANLVGNPKVALPIDNRSHSLADFHKATAATVIGDAHEAVDAERQQFLPLYVDAHPHLRDFVAAPTCAVVVVNVEKYSVVTQFQNVRELIFGL